MDEIFNTLTLSMTGHFGVALAAAFGWGVLSILLSPCHLGSIPLIVGYLSAREPGTTRSAVGLALIFAVGILMTIALMGVVTAGLGRMMGDVGMWGNIVVAGVFFVIGLSLLDVVPIPWGEFRGASAMRRG
ncbi:MAG: cytochrome c biogenesis protein CcdA, partial [Bacteroidota bacterium]